LEGQHTIYHKHYWSKSTVKFSSNKTKHTHCCRHIWSWHCST